MISIMRVSANAQICFFHVRVLNMFVQIECMPFYVLLVLGSMTVRSVKLDVLVYMGNSVRCDYLQGIGGFM